MQRGKSENENYYYFLDNKIKIEYNPYWELIPIMSGNKQEKCHSKKSWYIGRGRCVKCSEIFDADMDEITEFAGKNS